MDGAELKRRFGRKVQELRDAKGLTQDQLAARIGRSVDTVGNIERGVNATRIETAYQLAQVLGVRLPDLFDLEDELNSVERERREIMRAVTKALAQHDLGTARLLTDLLSAGLRLVERR